MLFRGKTDVVIHSAPGMDSLTEGPGQMGRCPVADGYVDPHGAFKVRRPASRT